MSTSSDLFREYSRALSFPAYFGHNWAAFRECLMDLEWRRRPSYLFLISFPQFLLLNAQAEKRIFRDALADASRYWSDAPGRGEIAFNTVLLVEQDLRDDLDWLTLQ